MELISLEKQAERLLTIFEAVVRTLRYNPNKTNYDLTKPQMFALIHIVRKKSCTMTELAKLTGYAMSACTGIVDRMIKKKLIKRVTAENDRRIVKVTATDQGVQIATSFYKKVIKNTVAVLEKLDKGEREKLVLLFEKIASGFEKTS